MLALAVADVAKEANDQKTAQQCYNTYHCQNKIIYQSQKTFGKYCGNRLCLICNSIRKAEIINKYFPTLRTWENAYFVTLTARSCKADELEQRVKQFQKAFDTLKQRYNKRHQRGKVIPFQGIRSLECNFNPVRRSYNPHFHIIVPHKVIADRLIDDWLELWGKEASPRAQYSRKVECIEREMIETIKYGSKVFTESKTLNSALREKNAKIYAKAFYVILKAFENKRLFAHFGFKVENIPQQKGKTLINKGSILTYVPAIKDWVNLQTGSMLTEYQPSEELENILKLIDRKIA